MKRANALQLAFVLVGLVYGILSLPSLFTLLVGIFVVLFSGGFELKDYIIFNVFSVLGIAIQIFVCWLLIIRSAKFAAVIQKISGFGSGFTITSKPNDLLHILLVAIGIYLILSDLSPLLRGVFESFKNKSSPGLHLYEDARPIDWTTLILNIVLPLILLMFAKPIADYFAKKLSNDEITIEETADKNDSLELTEE